MARSVVIDEIQRAPELFTSIKALVAQDRRPGRFILTGSANIMLIPKLADSLAGRMEVIHLAPLAQMEIENAALKISFLDQLFFVNQELRRQSSWTDSSLRFFHYRDKDKVEVDVVSEQNGSAICGVEVKASASVRTSDFAGLRRLKASHNKFICGVVLYDGDKVLPFGDRFYAVPFNELW